MTGQTFSHPQDISTGVPHHEAAQTCLKEWHRIAAERDWENLSQLLTDDVVFRNPASLAPCHGPEPMIAILQAVFSATEEDEELYGANLIEFSSRGKTPSYFTPALRHYLTTRFYI